MSERMHPDGLPVSATPELDDVELRNSNYLGVIYDGAHFYVFAEGQEQRARTAEADLAEMKARAEKAELTVAWLRSGANITTVTWLEEKMCPHSEVRAHLDSEPAEGWTP